MYKKILASILLIAGIFVIGTVRFSLPQIAFGATNAIPTPIALFETSLASGITSSATSMTLVSARDKDGNLLSGTYAFILDEGTANEEFVNADCTGTACTNMTRGLSVVTGTTSITALKKEHRRGASVKITDAPQLLILHRIINGISSFPNKLVYTSHPTFTTDTDIVDKKYVDDTAFAGAPDASTTAKGVSEEATQAEINAGTAAGGTGARLFVNPSTLLTSNYFNFLPTTTQKDALVGTSGSPSSSNKYVTNDDTATAATASKLARRGASGEVTVPTTPSASTDATSKSYVDTSTANSDTTNYVLGEAFTGATTPQPAYWLDDLYQYGLTSPSQVGVGNNEFGNTGGNVERRALKIIPKANVSIGSIRLQLAKVGAPADNALVEIQTDSAGSPSGSVVTNGTSSSQAGSGLSTSAITEVTLTFSTPPSLTAGTTYWVVLKRSGSLSGSDYYITAKLDSGNEYGSFAGKAYTGSWVSSSGNGNMIFAQLYPSTGKSWSLWLADSDAVWSARQFVGWVTTTGSANASATLVKTGLLSGFSGLSVGTDYYTSTTAGSYTNSGGGVYVGTATSATEMLVPKIKYGDGLVTTGPLTGFAVSGGLGTSSARYKLPWNGTFTWYWNTSGSNGTFAAYLGNSAGTYTTVYEDNTTGDGSFSFPYTRGQYVNIFSSTTGGSPSIRFTPIIE